MTGHNSQLTTLNRQGRNGAVAASAGGERLGGMRVGMYSCMLYVHGAVWSTDGKKEGRSGKDSSLLFEPFTFYLLRDVMLWPGQRGWVEGPTESRTLIIGLDRIPKVKMLLGKMSHELARDPISIFQTMLIWTLTAMRQPSCSSSVLPHPSSFVPHPFLIPGSLTAIIAGRKWHSVIVVDLQSQYGVKWPR